MRSDVTSGASESKAIVRRQVQIEVEVEALEKLQAKASELFTRLGQIAVRMSANQAARRGIPKEACSTADIERINRFPAELQGQCGVIPDMKVLRFAEVEIGKDTLVPCLAQMELRRFVPISNRILALATSLGLYGAICLPCIRHRLRSHRWVITQDY